MNVKKIVFGMLVFMSGFGMVQEAKADHLYGLDLRNVVRGPLPSRFIDCSSITCLGPNIGSAVSGATATLTTQISTTAALAYGLSLSTDVLRLAITTTTSRVESLSSSTDTLRTLITTHSVIASNTNYINTSSSFQQKEGPFRLTVGSLTLAGSVGTGMLLIPSGNVGIGTTQSGLQLVIKAGATERMIQLLDSSDNEKLNIGIRSATDSGFLNLFNTAGVQTVQLYGSDLVNYINTAQNFGFGTIAPSSLIQVHGGSITVSGNISGISVSTVSLRAGGKIVFPDGSEQATSLTIIANFLSTHSTHQDLTLNFLSTAGVLNNNQNTWLSTTTTELQTRSVPIRFSDEGTNLANATTVDCVGAGVSCTASGSTVTMTVAGGGSAVSNSTLPFTLGAGGDAFLATNTFCPVQSGCRMVSVATETTVSFQPYTLYPSTVGSTFFKIAKSTALDAGVSTAWTYISPHMEVSTNSMYGAIMSSAVTFNANEAYSMHVTSFPVAGRAPSEYGIKVRYWFNPYP